MKEPCIAVLLAAYNGEQYIGEQIESVLAQSYQNIRLIISDDFSTDNTPALIKQYSLKDDRISVIQSEKRLGSAQANFMFLLKNCTADYYMFCDQDDFWFPDKAAMELKEMQALEKPGMPVLVHTDLSVADKELNRIAESFFQYQKLSKKQPLSVTLIQNNVTGCTVMINSALRELALQKEDTRGILMHDWFLAILASCVGIIGFVDRPTMLYRQHDKNQIGAQNAGSISYLMQKIQNKKGNRKSLYDTFEQSAQIAALYGSQLGASYEILNEYGKNTARKKCERIKICRRYGIWKNTLPRKIGQILFL